MSKSIYDYFSYRVYRYAPESFKLYYKGKEIELSPQINNKYNFGNTVITKGKAELLKAIKQFVRTETGFSKIINSRKKLAIRTSDGSYINLINPYGYGIVNRYDMQEKLDVYKALKEAYNKNNTVIEMVTGEMGKDGKMTKGVRKEIDRPKLLNRIIYV